MTLKEKFSTISCSDWESQCEQTADEFAIGFAEWTSYKYKYLETKGWFGNSYDLEMGIFKSSKQLLEIYKNEKGL